MTRNTFRPESVVAYDDALCVLRSFSVRLGEKRGLLYGMALEYAADNEEDFLAYARAELAIDGDSSESGGTQRLH